MRIPHTRRLIPVVTVLALAACGGGDSDDTTGADDGGEPAEVATGAESVAPPTAPPQDDDTAVASTSVDGGVEIDEVPTEPAELPNPTATITGGGTTFESAGYAQIFDMESGGYIDLDGDFLICEAVNPAFEGDANIIVSLGDDQRFTFRVNDGEPYVQFGEEFFGEETNDVSFERDGNTITGTAELAEAGTVEYRIDCG